MGKIMHFYLTGFQHTFNIHTAMETRTGSSGLLDHSNNANAVLLLAEVIKKGNWDTLTTKDSVDKHMGQLTIKDACFSSDIQRT